VYQLQITVKFYDLLYLNANLDKRDSGNSVMLDHTARLANALVEQSVCRSDLLEAGLNFLMLRNDVEDPNTDYVSWEKSLTESERFLEHGLHCIPTSAVFWAKLAIVKQAESENSQELARLLTMSQHFSPTEIGPIWMRFFVYRRASPSTIDASRETIEADLQTLLTYGDKTGIEIALRGVSKNPPLDALMKNAYSKLSPERRTFLQRSGLAAFTIHQ